jgi:hypothetical protein
MVNHLFLYNDKLYGSSAKGDVFKSTDDGDTWQKIIPGLSNLGNGRCILKDSIFFSIQNSKFYKTTPGDFEWHAMNTSLDGLNISNLTLVGGDLFCSYLTYPAFPPLIVSYVCKSSDNGVNWAITDTFNSIVSSIFARENYLYLAAEVTYANPQAKVYRRNIHERVWRDITSKEFGLNLPWIGTMYYFDKKIFLGESTIRMAGVDFGGRIHFSDNDSVWSGTNVWITDGGVFKFVSYHDRFFICTGLGLYFSSDGGKNWILLMPGLEDNDYVYDLCFNNGFMILATSRGIFRRKFNE